MAAGRFALPPLLPFKRRLVATRSIRWDLVPTSMPVTALYTISTHYLLIQILRMHTHLLCICLDVLSPLRLGSTLRLLSLCCPLNSCRICHCIKVHLVDVTHGRAQTGGQATNLCEVKKGGRSAASVRGRFGAKAECRNQDRGGREGSLCTGSGRTCLQCSNTYWMIMHTLQGDPEPQSMPDGRHVT